MVLQKVKDTRVVAPYPHDARPQDYGLFTLPAAPVEYVVSQRSVTEGEYVRATPGAAATLFKLVIDRPLKLQATVPERHRAEVRVGQGAEFEVEAYPRCGDAVVTSGQSQLAEGTPVRVRGEGAAR